MFKKLFDRIKDFVVSVWDQTKEFVTSFAKSCRNRVEDVKDAVVYAVETLKSEGGLGILLSTIKEKTVEFFQAAWVELKRLAVDVRDNWEAAAVLVLSAIGLTHILGQVPLVVHVPAFIEAPLVLPVIATAMIALLTYMMLKKVGEPCLEQ